MAGLGARAAPAVAVATLIGAAAAPFALPAPEAGVLATVPWIASEAFRFAACGWPPLVRPMAAAVPAASVAATAATGTTLPTRLRAVLPRTLVCRPV